MGNCPMISVSFSLIDVEKHTKLVIIIDGIARCMQYLHEDSHARINHRDLKYTNVLLASDLKPQISCFGLARVFGGAISYEVMHKKFGTL
jgi:serine/threonine protein kinase